jgi:hypothetical protein
MAAAILLLQAGHPAGARLHHKSGRKSLKLRTNLKIAFHYSRE